METRTRFKDWSSGRNFFLLVLTTAGFLSPSSLYPQVQLGSVPSYAQDFNSLAASGVQTWNDNTPLPGWYARIGSGPAPSYTPSTGTVPAARLYSYGRQPSDRALGLQTTPQSPSASLGVRFRNDSGTTLHDFAVSYVGEQWRNASTGGQTLVASYRTSLSPIDSPTAGASSDWSLLPSLNFQNPAHLTLSFDLPQAVDGTSFAYQRQFVQVPLSGVALAPGEELFIRWVLEQGSGLSHGLAIDDFQLTWVPEPSSLVLFAPGLLFLLARRTRSTRNSSTPKPL